MPSNHDISGQLILNSPSQANLSKVISQVNSSLNRGINVSLQVGVSQQHARNINQLTNNVKKLSTQTKVASSRAEELGKNFASVVKRFGTFTAATFAFRELIRNFNEGISKAIDFQNELVRISQVTKSSLNELRGLSSEIGRLSKGLGTSSDELIRVSRILAQTGLSAKDTKTALEAIAKSDLAPTFENMEKTTEGAIAVFRQFNVEAKDLQKVLSSINAVAGRFAVESGDIIGAIRRAGGAFSAAGGSLNELIALFTSVRATTREAAESIATGFRTIFTRLQRTRTIDYLRKLGIELTDVEGKFVGPFEAVKRLSAALNQLEPGDLRFAQVAEELGGFRQISKIIPLIQQNALALDAYNVAIAGTNSLNEDAITAQQSLRVQLTKTRESFFELVRGFGDDETIKGFIKLMISMADTAIKLADAIRPLVPLIAAIGGISLVRGAKKFFGNKDSGSGFLGSSPLGFASGGVVPGAGNRDTIPAMLTPGEYVLTKSAVKAIGVNNLHEANKSKGYIQPASHSGGEKFAEGGGLGLKLTPKKILDTANKDHIYFDTFKDGTFTSPDYEFGGAFINADAKKVKESGYDIKQTTLRTPQKDYKINFFGGVLDNKVTQDIEENKIVPVVQNVIEQIANKFSEKLGGAKVNSLAKDGIPNLESMIGGLFEGALLSIGIPFSDTNDNQRTFDFPRGLDTASGLFSGKVSTKLKSGIPVDAKRTLTTSAYDSFRKKFLNYISDTGGVNPIKANSGGYIDGVGSQDTIPAMLTPGEFVINKKTAQKIGYDKLDKINKKTPKKFARGGVAGFASGGKVGSGFGAVDAISIGFLFQSVTAQSDALGEEFKKATQIVSQLGIQFVTTLTLLKSASPDFDARIGEGKKSATSLKTSLSKTQVEFNSLAKAKPLTQKDAIDKNGRLLVLDETIRRDKAALKVKEDLIKKEEKLAKATSIATVGLAVASTALVAWGTSLEKQAQDAFAAGDFEGGKEKLAQGRALKSGATAAGVGAIGVTQVVLPFLSSLGLAVPPLAALAVAATAAIAAFAYFYSSAKEQAKIEADRIKAIAQYTKSTEDLDRKLGLVKDNKLDPTRAVPELKSSAKLIQRGIVSSDSELSQEAQNEAKQSLPNIIAAANEVAKTSKDGQDVVNKLGEDFVRNLSRLTGTPVNELIKGFDEVAKAASKAKDFESTISKLVKAQLSYRTSLTGLAAIVKTVSVNLQSFDDKIKQIASFSDVGGSVSGISGNIGEVFGNSGGFRDEGKFNRVTDFVTSIFRLKGTQQPQLTNKAPQGGGVQSFDIGSRIAADAKDTNSLKTAVPNILSDLALNGKFKKDGDLDAEFKDAMAKALGSADFSSLGGRQQELVKGFALKLEETKGSDVKDVEFINKVIKDIDKATEAIFAGTESMEKVLKDSADLISSTIERRVSGLATARGLNAQAGSLSGQTQDIKEQRERFFAKARDREVNFNAIQGFRNEKFKAITGGKDIATTTPAGEFADIIRRKDKIQSLDAQSSFDSSGLGTVTDAKNLVDAKSKEKAAIDNSIRALEYFADTTNTTGVAQEKLAEIQKGAQQKFGFAEKLTFGSKESVAGLSQGLKATKFLGQNPNFDFGNASDEVKQQILSTLDAFSDAKIFNGKSGKDLKKDLIEQEAIRNGFDPKEAKELALKASTTEEEKLLQEIEKGFQTSIAAQQDLSKLRKDDADRIVAALDSNFGELISQIRDGIVTEESKKIETDKLTLKQKIAERDEQQKAVNELNEKGLSQSSLNYASGVIPQQIELNKQLDALPEVNDERFDPAAGNTPSQIADFLNNSGFSAREASEIERQINATNAEFGDDKVFADEKNFNFINDKVIEKREAIKAQQKENATRLYKDTGIGIPHYANNISLRQRQEEVERLKNADPARLQQLNQEINADQKSINEREAQIQQIKNPPTPPAVNGPIVQNVPTQLQGIGASTADFLSGSLGDIANQVSTINFDNAAGLLSEASKNLANVNIPTNVEHSLNADVNVNLNGAEVLKEMIPEVEKLISGKVAEGIAKFQKDNFGELPINPVANA